jgi:hypothetical protein
MILAAVVGAGASYALGTLIPPKAQEPGKQGAADAAVRTAVEEQLDDFGRAMGERIDDVALSVEVLTSQIDRLEKSLEGLKERTSVAASPAVAPEAGGSQAQPAPPQAVEEVVRQVLEERDKQERQVAEQRRAERQQQFSQMMQSRIDNYAQEKGWDVTKTEAVKNILNESSEKMRELFSGQDRGSPEARQNMSKLMEDTRTKLAELLTEDEMNELMRMTQFGGQRRGPGGQGQPPGSAPTPEGR